MNNPPDIVRDQFKRVNQVVLDQISEDDLISECSDESDEQSKKYDQSGGHII